MITFIIVGGYYCTVAVLGYMIWGQGVGNSITINVHSGVLGKVNNVLILLLPLTKYAMTIEPIAQDMTRNVYACYTGRKASGHTPALQLTPLPEKRRPMKGLIPGWMWFTVRFMMWALTCTLAIAIPQFDKLLGFAGSLFSFTTCLTFPCACFLKLQWNQIGKIEKAFNVALIVMGIVCAITGAVATVFIAPS